MSKHTFIMVGPHAGKTVQFRDYHFVNGRFTFDGSSSEAESLARILRQWGAFPEADAKTLTAPPADVGRDGNLGPASEASEEQTEPESQTEAAEEQEAAPEPATAAPETSAALDLAEAIGTLDPANTDHWTSNNLPAVDHLSDLTGGKVTRADVEAVAPGYTRAKAREV